MAFIIATAVTLILINTGLVECGSSGVNSNIVAGPSSSCTLGQGWQSHQIVNDTSTGLWPYQVFKSSPFNPPDLEIARNGQTLAPGLLIFSPQQLLPIQMAKEIGPLIMTDDGQLVWNGPNINAFNFRVATYQDAPILTFWSGIITTDPYSGHGYGNVTFLDASYNTILTVCPQFGLVVPEGTTSGMKPQCEADLHESFVTDRGTILVTAYNATPADLSSLGGPTNGWIGNSLFYELDPTDGKILFRWSAIEHVPVSQSKYPLEGRGYNQSKPLDYFHINSVVNIGNDGYLVSGRHTWAVYFLNSTGDIDWNLQGDTGVTLGLYLPMAIFITPTSFTLTIFNNAAAFPVTNGTFPSTGLTLQLPLPPSTSSARGGVTVLADLSDPAEPLSVGSQGSVQSLPNNNTLVGYGQSPVLKEYGPPAAANDTAAAVRWTARFGTTSFVGSYRAFKTPWHGQPTTPSRPALAVLPATAAAAADAPGNGSAGARCASTGYVSWNGATDVERWRVSWGASAGEVQVVGEVKNAGFETGFRVGGRCVQVAAVVGGGVEAAVSEVVCV